jgi:predicted metalloprotease with PDZ domain
LWLLLAQSYTTHKQGFTDPDLLALIHKVTGFDPTPAYQRYIQQGQFIDFTQVSLSPGLRVELLTDKAPLFVLAPAQAQTFQQFMVR